MIVLAFCLGAFLSYVLTKRAVDRHAHLTTESLAYSETAGRLVAYELILKRITGILDRSREGFCLKSQLIIMQTALRALILEAEDDMERLR